MKIKDIVLFFVWAIAIIAAASYGVNSSPKDEIISSDNSSGRLDTQIYLMQKKTANVFWKEKKKVFVNEEYIDSMSDPEKAALGYVSSFTLCQNLSGENLNFLKKWFRNDKNISLKLNDYEHQCTTQKEFESIKMNVTSDTITITYTSNETYPFHKKCVQEDTFKLYENYLVLLGEKKTSSD